MSPKKLARYSCFYPSHSDSFKNYCELYSFKVTKIYFTCDFLLKEHNTMQNLPLPFKRLPTYFLFDICTLINNFNFINQLILSSYYNLNNRLHHKTIDIINLSYQSFLFKFCC